MKIKATVPRDKVSSDQVSRGSLVHNDPWAETPALVQIQEADGGFLLCHLDSTGECLADTWHPTIEAAKEQANFEFGIEGLDWLVESEEPA